MQEFYHNHKCAPEVVSETMVASWIQTVVILTAVLRHSKSWYGLFKQSGSLDGQNWNFSGGLFPTHTWKSLSNLQLRCAILKKIRYGSTTNDENSLYMLWEYLQELDDGVLWWKTWWKRLAWPTSSKLPPHQPTPKEPAARQLICWSYVEYDFLISFYLKCVSPRTPGRLP